MGKNQIITKDTQSQGQGVCEKIFKALNLSSVFRFFSQNPKSATSSASKPKVATTDHHISGPSKATKFKLVVPQNESTNFPLHEVKDRQKMIPLHDQKDQSLSFQSNRVLLEYNHSSVDTEIPKSETEPMNESPVEMFATSDHLQNQDYYYDFSSNDRFSRYIDHVKNKIMSSFDDDSTSGVGRDSFNDKVSHYVDPSNLNIRTTTIACGDQVAA